MAISIDPNLVAHLEYIYRDNKLTERDEATLRGYRKTLLEAYNLYRQVKEAYHRDNPRVRHTSQCQCGMSYELWSVFDYGSDVLADVEATLGL